MTGQPGARVENVAVNREELSCKCHYMFELEDLYLRITVDHYALLNEASEVSDMNQ